MIKKTIFSLLVATILLPLSASVDNGEKAPGFTLKTAQGEEVSLSDYAGKTVVLEWLNPGCPFVRKFYSNSDMGEFQEKAKEMGVVWLSINSTHPTHRDYLTPKKSMNWAKEHDHAAKWLMDPEGSVGKAYGAKTTPHMFIINPEGKVIYQGAIDSIRNADPSSIPEATNYVMEALQAVESGMDIPDSRTRPYGCSVKYGS